MSQVMFLPSTVPATNLSQVLLLPSSSALPPTWEVLFLPSTVPASSLNVVNFATQMPWIATQMPWMLHYNSWPKHGLRPRSSGPPPSSTTTDWQLSILAHHQEPQLPWCHSDEWGLELSQVTKLKLTQLTQMTLQPLSHRTAVNLDSFQFNKFIQTNLRGRMLEIESRRTLLTSLDFSPRSCLRYPDLRSRCGTCHCLRWFYHQIINVNVLITKFTGSMSHLIILASDSQSSPHRQ